MINRRRRASSASVTSGKEEDVADDSTPEQLSVLTTSGDRKRRKPDPSELCQQLYDSACNIKQEDGSMPCDTFIRAPERCQEPSSYEVVANPIDLLRVQQNLKTESYEDIEELPNDFELAATLKEEPESSDDEDDEISKKCGDGPLWQLFDHLFNAASASDHPNATGAPLGQALWKLPYRRFHPEYYELIEKPISMSQIQNKLKKGDYSNISDLTADLYLMLDNAKRAFPPSNQIHKDAVKMLKIMNAKLIDDENGSDPEDQEMSESSTCTTPSGQCKKEVVKSSPIRTGNFSLQKRLLALQLQKYLTDYTFDGRKLMGLFMETPSKKLDPDYYNVIQTPIDMATIENNIKNDRYSCLDELISDYRLMFANCRQYNEEGSAIFEDSNIMEQVLNEKLKEITTAKDIKMSQETDNDEPVPDVALAVQELLFSLFTLLYNHQDDEGRCYSDSLAELSEYDESDGGTRVRGISLDLIKRRLDKGLYKRLDIFQEEVFACLERARRLSRTDSQIFEDSIELQAFFIRKRDKLCKDILTSTALNYSALHLSAAVEAVRQSKLLQGEQDQEDDTTTTQGESMTIDHKVYSPGDFVYFENPDNKIPGIAYIEHLWTNNDNVQMVYGIIFFRPHETYHVATRKFLEQEVFKSDQHQAIPLSRVHSKCFVMNIKDYIKMRPEGFVDKDIYVCESRYNIRGRSFKKMKTWPFVREKDPVKLVPREKPMELKRIMSVFKERVEKHKGELDELQLEEAMVEKEKPNVVCYVTNGEEGNTYYEQYNTICSGAVKIGDYVYVATHSGKLSIAQITSIWEADKGKSYFQGPLLLSPSEITVDTSKNFYRQELLLSTVSDSNPIIAIVGKCAVLDYAEYTACRPTEMTESDVYICDSTFDEVKKTIKKFTAGNGLRKFTHSQLVTPDEIFHFKQPIKPLKQPKLVETSSDPIGVLTDSLDGGGLPSVRSNVATTSSPAPWIASTPVSTEGGKSKSHKPKVITGYILFSSKMRKPIWQSNPNASFGEISRMVGQDWRNLPANVKQVWQDRAMETNKENAASILGNDNMCGSPTPGLVGQQQLYECLWNKCDLQFEDSQDCMEHCIQDGNGHVQQYYANKTGTIEYHCMWRTCVRLRKNLGAFPHLQRLIKHIKEVHLSKPGKVLLDKSKTLIHRKNPLPPNVLDHAEYTTSRPTEIPESDSTFDEVKETTKKFTAGNGLRKFTHSQLVTPDEIFHSKQPIKPLQEPKLIEISSDPIGVPEDPLDSGGPPSVSSNVATTSSPAPPIASTPVSTEGGKSKSNKPKVITGFILFSSEMRKSISQSNPNASFGDISRMVGHDWRNLATDVKQALEDRAAKTNKENAASILGNDNQQLYECLWDKCDLQFEDSLNCMEHCIQDGNGHVQQHYANKTGKIQYHCMWRTCIRLKQNLGAFPYLMRLIKHVREVHLSKPGKALLDKSKTLIHRMNPLSHGTSSIPVSSEGGTWKSYKPRVITGYILFSSKTRKLISQSNPNASFGEISRIVGQDWRNLPTNVKQMWEDRAMKTNKEKAASKMGIIDDNMCGSSTSSQQPSPQSAIPQSLIQATQPPEPMFVTVPPRPERVEILKKLIKKEH